MNTWERVREVLAGHGFTLVPGSGRDRYQGQVKIGTVSVSLEIEITDYDFLDLPKIRVLKRDALPKRLTAHIVSDGTLCYAEKATFLLDRYQPDRSVASCLEQARTTLNTLLHGNPSSAYMTELAAYWSATPYCLIDEQSGLTRCVFGVCTFQNGPQILIAGKSEERLQAWTKKAGGTFSKTFEAPVVHAIDAIRPPSSGTLTLEGATNWLQSQTGSARSLVDLAIGTAKERPSLLIAASNAIIGFRAEKTALIKKSEQGGFRASALPGLWKKEAGRARLETFHCVPASHDEIMARNLDRAAPLTGKRLAMIGCGTIGGYLARALVQLGAGQGAALLLIDHDDLKPENLGRHILGARHLWRNKAVALADLLGSDFPDAQLEAVAAQAQGTFDRLAGYDLVIDATGDEQFSEALNGFALTRIGGAEPFPPTLFTMLFGNGLAAQSYLARWEKGRACYRCLKPRFEGEWRFNPLKPEARETGTAIRPCAQGSFIPYAVPASMQAAALAATHASEVFLDRYDYDLRTVQVVPSATTQVPLKNVERAKTCPACST
ncbi:ThiF family adenylyltransferase [Paracoccus albus]|uniref:ThiF family adenylyltransferase n=1 Tax=Paracoccus albus TaxID=3017784 RepID=UPI0022F000F2|nr:ThiF family adenylyltransferase [Paracoccus albus]WBU62278.1 ThiF family adenylyltransferase [Paracoccus albus]